MNIPKLVAAYGNTSELTRKLNCGRSTIDRWIKDNNITKVKDYVSFINEMNEQAHKYQEAINKLLSDNKVLWSEIPFTKREIARMINANSWDMQDNRALSLYVLDELKPTLASEINKIIFNIKNNLD